MAYENIIVDTRDDVATITLNRPDALNALNGDEVRDLMAYLLSGGDPKSRIYQK